MSPYNTSHCWYSVPKPTILAIKVRILTVFIPPSATILLCTRYSQHIVIGIISAELHAIMSTQTIGIFP